MKIEILFAKISKYMVGKKKYLAGFEITKKRFLTIVIIGLVILIVGMITVYFAWTIAPISVFEALNKTSLYKEDFDKPYSWWNILFARLSSPDEPLNFRNMLIGIAGVVTLAFAWWRLRITDQQKDTQVKQTGSHIRQTESYIEQTKIESDRRLSERFDNAVKALSQKLEESSFPAHLGAISSLRVLAIDSPKNTQRCLDIICSCNQWMDGYMNEFIEAGSQTPYSALLLNEYNRIANKKNKDKITILHEKRSQEALVAINNILEKISTDNPQQIKTLKFYNKMLCGISLSGLKLDGIDFRNTYLVAASLDKTSLNRANLHRTNFQGASLENTELRGASLDFAELQRASLEGAELQGASLWSSKLQKAYLIRANLQGADIRYTNLQEVLLINAQLQGATMHEVNLSNAILLDCNLYSTTLKNIKSKNIIFNNIVGVGYIKDKEKRSRWLDDVCKFINSYDIKPFRKQMEVAWQAMEKNQKPDGLDIIEGSSIVTKDSKGMYDINEENLTNLKEVWQNRVKEKGTKFLWDIRFYILLLDIRANYITELLNEDISQNKNVNLANKLKFLIDQLIENN